MQVSGSHEQQHTHSLTASIAPDVDNSKEKPAPAPYDFRQSTAPIRAPTYFGSAKVMLLAFLGALLMSGSRWGNRKWGSLFEEPHLY